MIQLYRRQVTRELSSRLPNQPKKPQGAHVQRKSCCKSHVPHGWQTQRAHWPVYCSSSIWTLPTIRSHILPFYPIYSTGQPVCAICRRYHNQVFSPRNARATYDLTGNICSSINPVTEEVLASVSTGISRSSHLSQRCLSNAILSISQHQ